MPKTGDKSATSERPSARFNARMDLVRGEIWPVHEPEKRQCKQGANDHCQSREKPELLLLVGQHWLSPAGGAVWHNSAIIPGHGITGMGCSPHINQEFFSYYSGCL